MCLWQLLFLMGKPKIRPPHRIKTPDLIEIKFGKVNYVGEGTRRAEFYANPSKGVSQQMGEIYVKILFIYAFFFQRTYGSDLLRDFYVQYVKGRGSAQGSAFWGLEN